MIRFGTSGWRAVISDEFTFKNVRLVIQAIANVLRDDPRRAPQIVIGYDTRFLSERMAREAAAVFSANQVRALRCVRDAPTPAVSLEVRRREAAGAVYFTASHNPPEYNGLKYYDAHGAPAPTELTNRIEMEVVRLESHGFEALPVADPQLIEAIDPQADYLAHLGQSVDLERIRAADLKFAVDALFGTSREYLDRVLIENDNEVEVIHNFADPYFGGYSPECTAENLAELGQLVVEGGADLGLATDGDGDRFGIFGSDGQLVPADDVLALLLDYLATERGVGGCCARTVATSHLLDRVARKHGMTVVETPVGFKYIGSKMVDGSASVGAEQSAGFSLASHLPEKDGILACLLVAEVLAVRGTSLDQACADLWSEHGRLYHGHDTLQLTASLEEGLRALSQSPPSELAGKRVERVTEIDGVKLVAEDDSWCLVRCSGTEPVLRIYAEAPSESDMQGIVAQVRAMMLGAPKL